MRLVIMRQDDALCFFQDHRKNKRQAIAILISELINQNEEFKVEGQDWRYCKVFDCEYVVKATIEADGVGKELIVERIAWA